MAVALAGNLIPPGGPAEASGQMYPSIQPGQAPQGLTAAEWRNIHNAIAADQNALEQDYNLAAPNAPLATDPITETAKLIASDRPPPSGYGEFGYSVAVSGDTLVVGDRGRNSAYVFEKPVGGWSGNLTERQSDRWRHLPGRPGWSHYRR
jgi:hypothetical protein